MNIFFYLGWVIFFLPPLVEYFATFSGGTRVQPKNLHFFSTTAHFAKTLQNTQPMGAKKILLTQDKKNYSPTNEVTHPTETPLYLWYDVFMPPSLLLFFGELANNFNFSVNALKDLNYYSVAGLLQRLTHTII